MGGLMVAEHLVQSRPALKVLFMSGHPNEAVNGANTLEAGTTFLPKPFTPDGLVRKVRALLDQ
jgi:two-component system, cell cycle sensor histidine kinase and response regulator CckA